MNLAQPLSTNTLLGSAGLFALITALWDKIKLYWGKLIARVEETIKQEDKMIKMLCESLINIMENDEKKASK